MSDTSLTGRHAIVTGAVGGIGSAVSRRLGEQGAHVTLADVDETGLRRMADEFGAVGIATTPWQVDLTDAESLAALSLDADILVNNAGLQYVSPLHEFPPEQWQLMQQLMVTAPFLLIRAVLPTMYGRGWGRIVNMSSAHGLRASEYKGAYVAAKHGLEGLSKVTALEGASRGVTSMCINPGYVRTPLIESQIADQAAAHGIAESQVLDDVILASQPLKRLAEPGEVADAVMFACSEAATNMTGSNIALDGGWTAR